MISFVFDETFSDVRVAKTRKNILIRLLTIPRANSLLLLEFLLTPLSNRLRLLVLILSLQLISLFI